MSATLSTTVSATKPETTISPAAPQDVRRLFQIYWDAFILDIPSTLTFQHVDAEDAFKRFAKYFHDYEIYKLEEFSIDEATGKTSDEIIAFSVWKFVFDPEAEKENMRAEAAEREKKVGTPEEESPYIAGVNVELFDAFFKNIIKQQRALVADEKCASKCCRASKPLLVSSYDNANSTGSSSFIGRLAPTPALWSWWKTARARCFPRETKTIAHRLVGGYQRRNAPL